MKSSFDPNLDPDPMNRGEVRTYAPTAYGKVALQGANIQPKTLEQGWVSGDVSALQALVAASVEIHGE